MQVQGAMNKEMLEMSVKHEPQSKKMAILIGAAINMTAGIVIGSIYLSWYSNQNSIQKLYIDALTTYESNNEVAYKAIVTYYKETYGLDDPKDLNVYDNSFESSGDWTDNDAV